MSIQCTKDGKVAKIHIDYPPVNALDSSKWLHLSNIINDLSEDKSVNVIAITAGGKGFCGGADKSETNKDIGSIPRLHDYLWKAARSIHVCNIPVITACHGYAFGAGVFIPAAGDFILASEDAYFAYPGINFKVIVGGTHMSRLFPLNVVRKMILTGEPLYAKEAYAYGAITSIHKTREDLHNATFELAKIISSKDRQSLLLAKKSLNSIEAIDIDAGFKSEQQLTMNIDSE